MLKIRLTRTGKKNQAQYRIIVTEKRSKRDGDFIANLGYYTPAINPAILKLDLAGYDEWLKKGAQPTKTVEYLRSQANDSNEITIKKSAKTKPFKARRNAKAE